MDRLEEIKARERAATEGPWKKAARNTKEYPFAIHGDPDKQWDGTAWKLVCIGMKPHNAEFVAHARDDIPWLLGEIERMKDTINLLEESLINSEMNLSIMTAKVKELEQAKG